MDIHDRSMSHLSGRLTAESRYMNSSNVLYKVLTTLTLVLAALIAPLAWLTRKPVVPAFLGTAIVIVEGIQLIFRFNDDHVMNRIQQEKARLRALRDRSASSN